jgi:hypothetical protein
MSSLKITSAKSVYGGNDEAETLRNMAARNGYTRIYKYANDFGDKKTHTDLKGIKSAAEESEFLRAPMAHNRVLVFDNGRVL